MIRSLALIFVVALLAACRLPPPYEPAPQPRPAPTTPPPQPTPTPEPEPVPPPPPPTPQKQFRLGAASAALVAQAHTQAAGGNTAAAIATIERALRIEPGNPLLWIELGQINQAEGRYAQAHSMGRRAVQLGAGDPRAQASAWKLIAESLRAQGRNQEAAEAEERANALTVR